MLTRIVLAGIQVVAISFGILSCATGPHYLQPGIEIPVIERAVLNLTPTKVLTSHRQPDAKLMIDCDGTHLFTIPISSTATNITDRVLLPLFSGHPSNVGTNGKMTDTHIALETEIEDIAIESECPEVPMWALLVPYIGWVYLASQSDVDKDGKIETRLSLHVKVLDGESKLLFEEHFHSDPVVRIFPRLVPRANLTFWDHFAKGSWRRQTGEEFGVIVRQMLEENLDHSVKAAALGLTTSSRMRRYASSSSAEAKTAPTSTENRAGEVLSDVDQLRTKTTRQTKDCFAVLIGIEQYRDVTPAAKFASRDALAMAQYVSSEMSYAEQNILLLVNQKASLADFRYALGEWLPNQLGTADCVFIYYAGYGAVDNAGTPYLLPYDVDPLYLRSTGYPLKEFYKKIQNLKKQNVIVVLDTAFASGGSRSAAVNGSRPVGVAVKDEPTITSGMFRLTASQMGKPAYVYEQQQHGLFTYFFLKGLRDGDLDQDGAVDIDELYRYLRSSLETFQQEIGVEQLPSLEHSLGSGKPKLVSK